MTVRSMNVWLLAGVLAAGAGLVVSVKGQEVSVTATVTNDPPPVPKGVEVLARGPVHEAFASPTTDPAPTKPCPKQPPKPIDEMPPDEKPEGDVLWIGGYFHYDEVNERFLWVSGTWRTAPPGKQWVAGYWREDGKQWLWVPGFWTDAPKQDAPTQEVTYLPAPPEAPNVAPGAPPAANTFYIPGHHVWIAAKNDWGWQAGFWTKIQPGYVWVAAHYQWTPSGYIYIAGYWDLAMNRRGVLYAPVYVDTAVVDATYVYTPAYAVPETVVVDAMFVRPCCCHYYYGDYYEVRYRECGYTSCVVYSQTHYDGVIVYETTYVHREEPRWLSIQIDFGSRREREPELRPASTSITNVNYSNYVVNNTVVNNYSSSTINNNNTSTTTIDKKTTVNNTNFLMPAKQMASAKGVKTVKLDSAAKTQAKEQAVAVQQVAMKRGLEEKPAPTGGLTKPVTHTVPVAKTVPVGPKTSVISTPKGTESADTKLPPTKGNDHADPKLPPGKGTEHPDTKLPPGKGTDHIDTKLPPGKGTEHPDTKLPPGKGADHPDPKLPPGKGTEHPDNKVPPPKGTGAINPGGTIVPAGGTMPPTKTGTGGSSGANPPSGVRPTNPPPKPPPPKPDPKDKDKDKKPGDR
jgi:hypothetical protein